jgi:hypothetical protein
MVQSRGGNSLAMELARQASAAAKAEMAGEAPPAAMGPGRWAPALLTETFQLETALGQAVHNVAGHLKAMLHFEGLDVALPQAQAAGVMHKSHEVPTKQADTVVAVREGVTGRLVRTYTAPVILGLYASQHQKNGIVVDGQV